MKGFNKYKSQEFYTISITDVENIISFSIKDTNQLKDNYHEETRAKEELAQFISTLHSYYHEEIIYLGEEKTYDKHVEKFIFNHGGAMEIILENPVVIKANFVNKKRADKFNKALKKTLKLIIKEHPIKDIFINEIDVEKTIKDPINIEKWMKIKHIILKKSIIYSFIALFIFIIFEMIKAILSFISLNLFEIEPTTKYLIISSIISATIVALLFEPIRKFIEQLINKYFMK
ncbi:MAG: hypothetical protein ACLFPJ_01215 [Candidatus Woesearchaeota archaeon]